MKKNLMVVALLSRAAFADIILNDEANQRAIVLWTENSVPKAKICLAVSEESPRSSVGEVSLVNADSFWQIINQRLEIPSPISLSESAQLVARNTLMLQQKVFNRKKIQDEIDGAEAVMKKAVERQRVLDALSNNETLELKAEDGVVFSVLWDAWQNQSSPEKRYIHKPGKTDELIFVPLAVGSPNRSEYLGDLEAAAIMFASPPAATSGEAIAKWDRYFPGQRAENTVWPYAIVQLRDSKWAAAPADSYSNGHENYYLREVIALFDDPESAKTWAKEQVRGIVEHRNPENGAVFYEVSWESHSHTIVRQFNKRQMAVNYRAQITDEKKIFNFRPFSDTRKLRFLYPNGD